MSFYGVLTILTARCFVGWRRWAVMVTGIALILLIGFSRFYFGVHYPNEVAAGYLAATVWAGTVGTALLLLRSLRKQRRRG